MAALTCFGLLSGENLCEGWEEEEDGVDALARYEIESTTVSLIYCNIKKNKSYRYELVVHLHMDHTCLRFRLYFLSQTNPKIEYMCSH